MATISGFYGGFRTPCTVYTFEDINGITWYAVEGSVNVNATYQTLEDAVWVEEVSDVDTFTASSPIEGEEQLEEEVNA